MLGWSIGTNRYNAKYSGFGCVQLFDGQFPCNTAPGLVFPRHGISIYEYVHFFVLVRVSFHTCPRAPVVFNAQARQIAPDGSLFTNKKSSQFETNRGFTRG